MANAYTRRVTRAPVARLFLRVGREQQWIAFASAGVRRIGCFGFCHIFCVDGDDTRAAPMSSHHHPQSLIFAHAKFRLQNRDDELAGCELIIEQDDFMQTRPFDFYLILDLGGDRASRKWTPSLGTDRLSVCETIASANTPKQHTTFLDLYKCGYGTLWRPISLGGVYHRANPPWPCKVRSVGPKLNGLSARRQHRDAIASVTWPAWQTLAWRKRSSVRIIL